jgi:hypothetical protein
VLQQPLGNAEILYIVYTLFTTVVQAESALDLQQTYIVALEAQMRSMSRPAAPATTISPSSTTAAVSTDATATETTAGEDTSSSSEADKAAAAAANNEAAAAAAATAAENARAAEAESIALQQLSDRIAELQRKHICTTSNTTC